MINSDYANQELKNIYTGVCNIRLMDELASSTQIATTDWHTLMPMFFFVLSAHNTSQSHSLMMDLLSVLYNTAAHQSFGLLAVCKPD